LKTLLVLQEPTGTFSPSVQKTLFKVKNLVVSSSKSGECCNEHVELYHSKVLGPYLQAKQRHILVQDCWGGQRDEELIRRVLPPNVDILLGILPPKTISKVQPFNVFFFNK
jgi:hypothetical protein